MSANLSCDYSGELYKGFTYQHLQGCMLLNLNRVAMELKLSHSEFHLMAVLIGFWNKKQGKAFPSIKTLAETARMSNSTILKTLKKLCQEKLILIIKFGSRQNYYINLQILLNDNSSIIPCGNSMITDRKKLIDKTNLSKYQNGVCSGFDNDIKNNSSGVNIPGQKNRGLPENFLSKSPSLVHCENVKNINEKRLTREQLISQASPEDKKVLAGLFKKISPTVKPGVKI